MVTSQPNCREAGFTLQDNDGKSGLYWVAGIVRDQLKDDGTPYLTFVPAQFMQNAMPELKPMLIETDAGLFISIPDNLNSQVASALKV